MALVDLYTEMAQSVFKAKEATVMLIAEGYPEKAIILKDLDIALEVLKTKENPVMALEFAQLSIRKLHDRAIYSNNDSLLVKAHEVLLHSSRALGMAVWLEKTQPVT